MRVSLLEYGKGAAVDSIFPPGTPYAGIKTLLGDVNAKVRRHLRITRDAFTLQDGRLRALGVAGTIRLSKDIELEIVPKMLSADSGWREPLFLLAALSKYGDILTGEQIRSRAAGRYSLYDIAGRVLAEGYLANRRTLLRQYRREAFSDFSIDGEINFAAAFERNPDGIAQEHVVFDKVNPYNAAISEAMGVVLPYVKDMPTRSTLLRARQELGRQEKAGRQKMRVPARSREWQDVYQLSFDIIRGMGTSLDAGALRSPGFLVSTWQIWEWLVTMGMRVGLGGGYAVVPQAAAAWGVKSAGGRQTKVTVFPDVAVFDRADRTAPVFLVDAKYKTIQRDAAEVDRSDLYEAFAFCDASGAKKLYLAYPSAAQDGVEPGAVTVLAKYAVRDISITAVQIAFGAIGRHGDISSFCRRMAGGILSLSGP